ncbi:HAD-like domain-containing protein [Paraphoma chrysanthemicola]|uniref:HAD-like domain-containing protein n=1 Tax=Paraphoma chrysanthemicola TaxID=798071 RepID=A0A8K0VV77_9PLEO|nr:HAD-like domain-containing protein [Paraphoma chrysanthemicola]
MSTHRPPLPKRPIHWILDWDGTMTQKDTLDTLVNIAASTKPDFPTRERWKEVVAAYMDDYTTTLNTLSPNGALPITIKDERTLLENMKPVEQRSLDRVAQSKIFAGMTAQQLGDGARKAVASGDVALRAGCVDFLRFVTDEATRGAKLHILSVNWSRHFIASCLKSAGAEIDSSIILANELEGIPEGRESSGQISPGDDMRIVASWDKLRYLEELRRESQARVVYVGDSWTDVECLVGADLGVCIRDEGMGSSQRKLAEALERLSVDCPRLSTTQSEGGADVVWARDFTDLLRWVDARGR